MRDTNQLFITFHYESSDKAESLSSPFPSSPGSLKPGIDLLLYDIKQNGQKKPHIKIHATLTTSISSQEST